MKKALIVGIDYYADIPSLYGCVADARAVKHVQDSTAVWFGCEFAESNQLG